MIGATRIEALTTDPLLVVHQAVGMLMEYLDCSAREALTTLIALGREHGLATPDVAADVVERRLRIHRPQRD